MASGLLGAMAYPNQNGNLLSVMATPGASALTTQICVYIFSLGVIGKLSAQHSEEQPETRFFLINMHYVRTGNPSLFYCYSLQPVCRRSLLCTLECVLGCRVSMVGRILALSRRRLYIGKLHHCME